MPDDDRTAHWQHVYTSKPETGVSWFEATPRLSLSLIEAAELAPGAAVVDVGGGASRLVDALAGRGHPVTVLDISAAALAIARARLGAAAASVDWVAADVTGWTPTRRYGLWHDRAVFHFLVDPKDRAAYVRTLTAALDPGGAAIIGTFAPDGPERCSGLPVVRYDAATLAAVLGPGFELVDTLRHDHATPSGTVQKFQFSTFRKRLTPAATRKPPAAMSFAKLDTLGHRLEALEHALSILRADEATNMPSGGGEKRAEAVSALAGMYHAQATAPEIADWIEAAEGEDLDTDQRLALGEFRRQYTNMTCLPSEFVERQVETAMRSEQLWRELRAKNDWKGFAPALEGVVALVREEAQRRSEILGLAPYDALMEQYDPGNRTADITPVFDELKGFLRRFVPEALERQSQRLARRPLKPLQGPYAVDRQRALGLEMMQVLGFDFDHGRLDISHHPFCGGVPTDVRMTTRYVTTDFLSSLMGILHETGHALYEQNLPKAWSHWPLGKARGMGVHESQSLFVEKQIARSAEFWTWAEPLVREMLGAEALAGWTLDDILAHVHLVERGLIRVDADELTYPLHVILRYELEQDLVTGRLEVADLPEAWDAKMRDYLGLSTLDNPRDGPMQDVHWPSGALGYFPSYTLGAMMAAQQWAALETAIPDARAQMARGEFAAINGWRRDRIWSEASRYSTPELMTRATGEPLNAKYFIAHLERRYGN